MVHSHVNWPQLIEEQGKRLKNCSMHSAFCLSRKLKRIIVRETRKYRLSSVTCNLGFGPLLLPDH